MNVLFLCTGNHPRGEPHPAAMETLAAEGFDTQLLRSKRCDEFSGPDAPALDFVITLCDSAAAESCRTWSGAPRTLHWGLPDTAHG